MILIHFQTIEYLLLEEEVISGSPPQYTRNIVHQ